MREKKCIEAKKEINGMKVIKKEGKKDRKKRVSGVGG